MADSESVREHIELLNTAERREKVLKKKRAGKSYRTIAEEVEGEVGKDRLPNGWGPRYAHQDVTRELDKYRDELRDNAEGIVELEVQRLNEMLAGVYPQAKNGHLDSVDAVLDIMERRSELLGLDEAEEYLLKSGDGFAFTWADPAEAPGQTVETSDPKSAPDE